MEPTGSLAPLGIKLWCALVCLAVGAAPLAAQVGHPPSSSPYRDIRRGHTLTLTGGYFSGDGGDLNIGPQDGAVYGMRYDIRTSRTVQLGFGLARGNLQRFIVNPFVPPADRVTGPVDQSVTFLDLNVQMNVTGGKSWYRFAPYVQLTGGLAVAGDTPADTSQFDFGNKLYFAPSAGFRLFLSQRLHLRAEARATFWKLNYPITFQTEPEPGTPAVITGTGRTEWVTSPWLQAGVGYSFSP